MSETNGDVHINSFESTSNANGNEKPSVADVIGGFKKRLASIGDSDDGETTNSIKTRVPGRSTPTVSFADDDDVNFRDLRTRTDKPRTGTTALMSERSKRVLDDSQQLLKSIQLRHRPHPGEGLSSSMSMTAMNGSIPRSTAEIQADATRLRIRAQRSLSPEPSEPAACAESGGIRRHLLNTPSFPRIDFDDWIEDELSDRKPAWQQLQEKVKSSYNRPRSTAERNRQLNEFNANTMNHVSYARQRRRFQEEEPAFAKFSHLDSESFIPRMPTWLASGAMEPRGWPKPLDTAGSGPYCAPLMDQTQGIEKPELGRYNRKISDIEARLLTRDARFLLPETIKTLTKRDFRRAPDATPGSHSEAILTEDDYMHHLPRPYYSRPNRNDKDYFDFDLRHSIDLFKKPEGRYFPRGPQNWENKVVSDARAKSEIPISAHLFTAKDAPQDWRNINSSYLSAALRTPSFWEHRFNNLGQQVRDSNPVSFQSIERNRPRPNKFNTYKNPDFEGLGSDDE